MRLSTKGRVGEVLSTWRRRAALDYTIVEVLGFANTKALLGSELEKLVFTIPLYTVLEGSATLSVQRMSLSNLTDYI